MKDTYKVLLINGSPHVDGCTKRALEEVSNTLKEEGIETEILDIGHLPIFGYLADVKETKEERENDIVEIAVKKFEEADGLVVGAPVYYSSAPGTLISFLDRLFACSKRFDKTMKVGAAVCSARRAGTLTTFDEINKYFMVSNMPVASSQYWNEVYGSKKEDVEKDFEGLQSLRVLARNMAFLIKSIDLGKEKFGLPKKEEQRFKTNFVDGK